MKIDLKISHEDIKAYLQDKIDSSVKKNLLEIRKEDPVYNLFFQAIDKVKGLVDITESQDWQKSQMSFETLEDILIDILGGQIQPGPAQEFKNELIHSRVSYERLLLKLSQIIPLLEEREIPEMTEVEIKSGDQLLANAGIISSAEAKVIKPGGPGLREGLSRIINLSQRIPKYAFILPVMIIAALAAFLIYKNFSEPSRFENYRYADKVPYEFDYSSLRQLSDNSREDSLAQSFVKQFKRGISKYELRDYQSAIRILETLPLAASRLLTQSPNEEFLPWIRDFYFYLGLSHFALSREDKITGEAKRQHSHQSIKFLSHAEFLVDDYNLDDADRETYFLGLAYGFAGDKDLALDKLRKISPESGFYKDSLKLIEEWSNK